MNKATKVLLFILIVILVFQSLITNILSINFIHIILFIIILFINIDNIELSGNIHLLIITYIFISLVVTRLEINFIVFGFIPTSLFALLPIFIKLDETFFEKSCRLLLILGAIVSIIGIYQYFFDLNFLRYGNIIYQGFLGGQYVPRIYSVFPSYQSFSVFLAVVIILNINYINKNILTSILLLINLFALILTFTRSGWVLLSLSILLYFFLGSKSKNLVIIMGIFFLIFYFIDFILPISFIQERFNSTFDLSESGNQGRLDIYKNYLRLMSFDTFFVGDGLGITSQKYVLRFNTKYFISTESQYLKLFFEGGIILLLNFLMIQFSTIKLAWQKKNIYKNKFVLFSIISFVPILFSVHILEIWIVNFLYWYFISYLISIK